MCFYNEYLIILKRTKYIISYLKMFYPLFKIGILKILYQLHMHPFVFSLTSDDAHSTPNSLAVSAKRNFSSYLILKVNFYSMTFVFTNKKARFALTYPWTLLLSKRLAERTFRNWESSSSIESRPLSIAGINSGYW